MNFQIIVLSMASLLLIVMLTVIGVIMWRSKSVIKSNIHAAECPDGFLAEPIISDTGTTFKCTVPSTLSSAFSDSSSGVYKFAGGKSALLNYSSVSGTIDFSDAMWKGDTGSCYKYMWATKNQYTDASGNPVVIRWDGLTNVGSPCAKS